jgi:hypothetical protein
MCTILLSFVLGVYEAPQGCGPIRSPPNMTKILDAWDIGTKLRERGITKSAIIFRDGVSSTDFQ